MSRYADIEPIIKKIKNSMEVGEIRGRIWFEMVLADLEKLPTVDAVPVVHGHWEEEEVEQWENGGRVIEDWQMAKCSKCGKWHTTPYMYYFDNYNYCPHCGAKMDEVTE